MGGFLGRNFRNRDGGTIEAAISKSLHHLRVLLTLINHGLSNIVLRFNLIKTIDELKELGKKHGPYFLAYAVCIELFEDLLLPVIFHYFGKPHLIPLALAFHCEPIAYPLYFVVASTVKKLR